MITLTQESTAAPIKDRVRNKVVADRYYSLVHWLRSGFNAESDRSPVVGITSCTPGAGTSTVALNLALAASQLGQRPALLIDLSGHGNFALRLGVSGDAGLNRALTTDLPAGCVKATDVPNLFFLGIDEGDGEWALNLDRAKVKEFVRSMEPEFGLTVIDLPSTESSVCFAVAGLTDGVLLIMEAERTRRDVAIGAQQRLIEAQANVLGVVLNKHRQYIPNWLDVKL
jgi:Mrp family chromosome partitioning ATPase